MPPDPFQIPETVPGAQDLYEWFGYWPSFHDAEILSLNLDRSGISTVRVHSWDRPNRISPSEMSILDNHVLVSFLLTGITNCDLDGFNHQNVVGAIELSKVDDSYVLELFPCFGLAGTICARDVRIELRPGNPRLADSK